MISVSTLTGYLYCARKVYMNNVLRIYGQKRKEAVSGTIMHAVIEHVNNNEKEIVEAIESPVLEDIEIHYRANYNKALSAILDKSNIELERLKHKKENAMAEVWPVLLEEAKLRARNVHEFMQKHNVIGKELWERLAPKYVSEVSVASFALGLRGRIDRVEKHSEDCLIPLEMKTGKAPKEGLWDNHRIQLAAYILLLKEKYPNVNEGYVEYLDIGERRQVVLNPFIENEVRELVSKVKVLVSSAVPPEKESNKAKCTKCELREQCEALN
ncbi:MAG: CRISPR-associated protein Cas4 [Candidatus Nanoarchaeia archaeon]|nr:CRISPR-associated protein Cas4 [Candidatus Nanoarchaeia archaeon]